VNKIDFQRNIAQLYIDVEKTKKSILEKMNIENFSNDFYKYLDNIQKKQSSFFYNEINQFKISIENRKNKLLENYKEIDIDNYIEEKAKEYFQLTKNFIAVEPDFYDSFIIVKPTWKKDYIELSKYFENLKNKHPHVKMIAHKLYKSISEEVSIDNHINYGHFSIATDIKTAFIIYREIENRFSASVQINFLAIDPAFIPKFNKKEFEKINNLTDNKVNNYLDAKVIASLTKGHLTPNDTPITIMKIFLNDEFMNNLNYHYIDNKSGENITITKVSKEFLSK
tara:strand:- start:1527 stop:2372 length:846 start_codon:yes stop_codon:yes gene_type:complete